jgi:hypothetical protein
MNLIIFFLYDKFYQLCTYEGPKVAEYLGR